MTTTPNSPQRVGPIGDIVRSNVLRLLDDRGISRARLIERVGHAGRRMDFLALRRVLRGERRVDVDDLCALADALGVTPARLLEPPTECGACHGTPPSGFSCNECGAGTSTPKPLSET